MTNLTTQPDGIKARLAKDGFAVVDLLDRDDLQALGDAYRASPLPADAGFDSTILGSDVALRVAVDRAVRAVIEPRLRALIDGYRLAVCTFVVKRSGREDGEVPIHQDWSFVDETRHASFGVWCPLVDVDPTNGCLSVVKGSHAAGHPPRAACSSFLYPGLEELLRRRYLTDLPMRAGQAALFDNRLFHCSPPNRGGTDRVAATAIMVPTAARLRYYHMLDRRHPHRVEAFDVADDFYLSHLVPGRPAAAVSLGVLDIRETAAAPPAR